MERFNTLSEKLINFYAHRFFVAESRLSWAVLYMEDNDGRFRSTPILKINESDYYIDIDNDRVSRKPRNSDVWANEIVDAWFSETDKNLRHGCRSGKVVAVELEYRAYTDAHSCGIVYDYDLEYRPDMSVKGTIEEVYTLDLYSYKFQIAKERLRWGVIELNDSDDYAACIPILSIKDHENAIITLDYSWVKNLDGRTPFRQFCGSSLLDAELDNHTLRFTNSKGKPASYDLEKYLILEQYQYQDFITVATL